MPTLDWLNRAAAFDIAKNVPYRLLEAVSEHRANVTASDVKAPLHKGKAAESTESRPDLFSGLEPKLNKEGSEKPLTPAELITTAATEDNLLIQGDNLEALKALLPFYRGQVKCIFIDPPYNTKSAFEHYDDNLEHAQWLSMMLPRLQLLRELLTDDGSIWVTIDDNEGQYLKVMMDEVFGRGNFVANVVWQKSYTSNQTAKHLSDTHDHVLLYARKVESLVIGKLTRTEDQIATFKNPDGDMRGPWKAENLSAGKFYSAGQFPIKGPLGDTFLPPTNRYWRCNQAQYETWLSEGRITFGLKGTGRPMLKKYLAEMEDALTANTWWDHAAFGSNKEASVALKELLEGTPDLFQTPKPEKLMQRIIGLATNPNDLILDSFLGSGTTAAVAQKMGRRWIGIEMGEHAKTHCLPRLQKVLDGEQGGISKAVNWQGGGSFRFMQLGAPVFDETGSIHAKVRFATLAAFVWMQETRTPWHKKKGSSPYLGSHDGVAYYLLFNGILGDRRPQGGNVLTRAVLDWLTVNFPHPGPRVIFGESVRVGPERLVADNVAFRSIPHEVDAR